MFNTIFINQQKKFAKISVLDKKTNYSPSWFVKVHFSLTPQSFLYHTSTPFGLAAQSKLPKKFLISLSAT